MRLPIFRMTSFAFGLLILAAASLAADESTCVLATSDDSPSLNKITVSIDVAGSLKFSGGGKVEKLPLRVTGQLAYHEKTLQRPADAKSPWRSVRFYETADVDIKIKDGGFKPALSAKRRLIAVDVRGADTTLFSPRVCLSREELDLIDVIGNSLILDRLLPGTKDARKVGDSWKPSPKIMAALLRLDAVSQSDVECKLAKISDSTADIEMTGALSGAISGVSSDVQIKAKLRFDRQRGKISSLEMTVKEDRAIGHADPGLDVTAKLRVMVEPLDVSEHLSDTALAGLKLERTDKLSRVKYVSVGGGFSLRTDRRWRLMSQRSGMLLLRMIDRGELVAQCNVATAKPTADKQAMTLSQFSEEVRKVLGKNLKQITAAKTTKTTAGHRMLRVTAVGTVSDLPIQWIYCHVSDGHGHGAVFAFTLQRNLLKQFDQADAKIVPGTEFLERKLAKKRATADDKSSNDSVR
jgi:hypothetical protein